MNTKENIEELRFGSDVIGTWNLSRVTLSRSILHIVRLEHKGSSSRSEALPQETKSFAMS
jgi:hypothetical protein